MWWVYGRRYWSPHGKWEYIEGVGNIWSVVDQQRPLFTGSCCKLYFRLKRRDILYNNKRLIYVPDLRVNCLYIYYLRENCIYIYDLRVNCLYVPDLRVNCLFENCRTTNGSGCVPQQRNYKCIYPRVPITDVYTSNVSSSR